MTFEQTKKKGKKKQGQNASSNTRSRRQIELDELESDEELFAGVELNEHQNNTFFAIVMDNYFTLIVRYVVLVLWVQPHSDKAGHQSK